MTTKRTNIRKSWNAVSNQWNAYMQPLFASSDFIWGPFGPTERQVKLFPKLSDKRVLIAGCGAGADVCYFAMQRSRVTGVDISDEQLASSRQMLQDKRLSAELIRGDLNQLGRIALGKNQFDLVVSSYVLQYVKDLKKFFRTVQRVLKPGGQMIFSLDHPVLYAHYPRHQGKTRNRDAGKFFNYLEERKLHWLFNLKNQSTPAYSYHRTFGTILHALVEAGLQLEVCLEPKPSLKGENHHRALYGLAQRIPHTLIVSARKPV